MACSAILVGNTDYDNLTNLPCCKDDILAINDLLKSTEKYESITIIQNTTADVLKEEIRLAVEKIISPEEIFFYFTGHGYHNENDFYFCAKNFNPKRPNETGISNDELHTLLRLANAGLVAKIIDACNSGVQLLKSENVFMPNNKEGFSNLIQISSCLDSQNSLTGDPLSLFTEKFISAALRKTEGTVYYTDITNTLRDEFIENNLQTPFFVSQHTGREKFVDDAKRLDDLRKQAQANSVAQIIPDQNSLVTENAPLTLLERIREADRRLAKAHIVEKFANRIFDNLTSSISISRFSEYFEVKAVEHSQYKEETTEKFMIRVLSKEKRPDNFVTAIHTRELKQQRFGESFAAAMALYNPTEAMYVENWDLYLNCSMKRAQVCFTLLPKFEVLQQINLVVSCAPSLDLCYIFETITQHMLRDFGKFEPSGIEISQRWWKCSWDDNTDGIIKKISDKLIEAVTNQLEATEARIAKK